MKKKHTAPETAAPSADAALQPAPATVPSTDAGTLLPPAEPDEEYDSYLLIEDEDDSPRAEAEYAAVLWPDEHATPAPAAPRAERRMTKDAFTRAMAEALQRTTPVYQFRTVSPGSVARLNTAVRAIVDAPPGSGKTWALVRRILRLAAKSEHPEDILVLCASQDDRHHLLTALRKAARRSKLGDAWKRVPVRTFDEFARELISKWLDQESGSRRELSAGQPAGWSPQTLKETGRLLRDHSELVDGLEHVLVDDIQNIVGQQAAFLLQLLGVLPDEAGFTLFGDRCQALFDLPSSKSNYGSADQLYGQLMHAHTDAELLGFEGNRRSSDEVAALSAPYRRAILSGRPDAVDRAASGLLRKVRSQDIAWQHLHPTSLRSLVTGKSLGILTRTTGEALAISNLLHQAGIAHNLALASREQRWAGWLGRVLLACESDSLDEESFTEIFRDLYPEAEAGPYWEALTASQNVPSKKRHAVRDLLAGIQNLPDRSDLGASPDEEQAAITVGTIRMSRGSEFDTVLLASDLFNGGGYTDRAQREAAQRTEAEALAEARLVYVGLTRAKRRLYLMMLPLEAVRLSQVRSRRPPATGRWYKSQIKRLPTAVLKSYRRRSLQRFEVDADDFRPASFAESEDAQTYLLTTAPDLPDAEMELRLEENAGKPAYRLFDPEQPSLQLAVSEADFAAELAAALGYAQNIKRGDVSAEHYPEAFRDVYVERVVTHIGPAEEAPPYAKIYGDLAVWLGLDVAGFARAISKTAPPGRH